MKKIANILIRIYLWPLKVSSRLALYANGLILRNDEHFLATIDLIKRKFPDDLGVIVDIGAYDGDSTIYLAKALPNNIVLGFEPNPVPFERAVNVSRRFNNIMVFNIGFSNQEGSTDFYLTRHAVSSSLLQPLSNPEIEFNKKIKIEVVTLDSYFMQTDNILLLKLDVQGAELRILETGEKTLRKTKLVLTEMLNSRMYEGECQYFQVDELLRRNNFQLYSIFTSYNNQGMKYFDALYLNRNFMG